MNPYVIDMIKNNYLEKSDYLEIILNFFAQIKEIPENKIHKTYILGEAFNWKLSLKHYYSEFENLCEIDDFLFIPYEFNQKEREKEFKKNFDMIKLESSSWTIDVPLRKK